MIINVIYLSVLAFISIQQSQSIGLYDAPKAINRFSVRLLEKIYKNSSEDANLVLSSYTVWTTLAIVNEGAVLETARELQGCLNIPPEGFEREEFRILQQSIVELLEEKQQGIALDITNELFIQQGAALNMYFDRLVRFVYHVIVQEIDFKDVTGSAKYINERVSFSSRGRFRNLVNEDIISKAKMLVTSALFFKGLWKHKFDAAKTREQPFYNEHQIPIANVPMMQITGGFAYNQLLNTNADVIEIPYVGNRMTMIIVVPHKNTPLLPILRQLVDIPMGVILRLLRNSQSSAAGRILLLPRFNVSSDLTLNIILREMGINDAFHRSANFSGVSNNGLFIKYIFHKANIVVDEEGTVGRAATILVSEARERSIPIAVNRPFAYFVVDKETHVTVLSGRIGNPIK